MKIVLLDNSYTIRHEFDSVTAAKSPKKWDRRVLTYQGKHYTHHDSQEESIHTFVEAEVIELKVSLEPRK